MNTIKEKYREAADKHPLFWSTLSFSGFVGVILACSVAVIFLLLWATGIYDTLEAALDLKHNSVYFMVPLCTAAALSAVCMLSGFLLYFHKYSRPKVKSSFRDALAPALGMEVGKKG